MSNDIRPSTSADPSGEDTQAELNKRHDQANRASNDTGEKGGLGEGGGLGGEAGVTSPGNAADGGPGGAAGHVTEDTDSDAVKDGNKRG